MLVEAVFKQQEKEKRHALEKVNDDFEVEKRNEKSRTSSEISHLKILMGEFSLPAVCAVCAQVMLYSDMSPIHYCRNIKLNASTSGSYHYRCCYHYYSDNIAHNLITPIQSINMGIELLKSEYSAVIGERNQDQQLFLFLCCF